MNKASSYYCPSLSGFAMLSCVAFFLRPLDVEQEHLRKCRFHGAHSSKLCASLQEPLFYWPVATLLDHVWFTSEPSPVSIRCKKETGTEYLTGLGLLGGGRLSTEFFSPFGFSWLGYSAMLHDAFLNYKTFC